MRHKRLHTKRPKILLRHHRHHRTTATRARRRRRTPRHTLRPQNRRPRRYLYLCPTTTDAPGNATGHAARAVRQNDVTASNRNTSGPPLRQPKSRSLADTHTRRGPSVTASRLPEGLSGARPFDPPLMGPPGFLPSIVKDPVSATPSKSISEFSSPKTGADQLEMAIAAPINKPKILPRDIVRPFPNTLLDLPRSVQVTEAKC